jgi:hypothetical protein
VLARERRRPRLTASREAPALGVGGAFAGWKPALPVLSSGRYRPGMVIVAPARIKLGLAILLAAASAATETPVRAEIAESVSPGLIT